MSVLPNKLQPWIDARKKFKPTHAQIQMARELGMNPRKFGKFANHRQQPWKLPLPAFIEKCYEKRFGRAQPEVVRSLEQVIKDDRKRKHERRQRKALARQNAEADAQLAPELPAADF